MDEKPADPIGAQAVSARVIRADGMEWPLQTFLDARGFHAFDYDRQEVPDVASDPVKVEAVLTDLTIITRPAEDVLWQDVAAWRFADGEEVQCTWCDDYCAASESTEDAFGGVMCVRCADNSDWDW